MKRSLNVINNFTFLGEVVTPCSIARTRTNALYAQVRLRSEDDVYVDLHAFGDVAKALELACKVGNTILVHCRLTQKQYTKKSGVRRAKSYWIIAKPEDIYLVKKAKKIIISAEEQLDIIDELDPATYHNDL